MLCGHLGFSRAQSGAVDLFGDHSKSIFLNFQHTTPFDARNTCALVCTCSTRIAPCVFAFVLRHEWDVPYVLSLTLIASAFPQVFSVSICHVGRRAISCFGHGQSERKTFRRDNEHSFDSLLFLPARYSLRATSGNGVLVWGLL
jgi:hypothetical protein